jgi:basic membrane protein A
MTTKTARIAALVAAVAALGLLAAGCGGSSNSAAPTPTETTVAPQLKVGLITDIGQLNDHGFNELAYKGLKRAERELGIKGRVLESKSAADYVPNMSTLARQGFDLVIGVGFAQGDAIASAAKKFPDTKFAIVDVDQASLKGKPANVEGLLFREQEVGYIVGYLAALTAKRDGADAISAVGGFKEPPVDRYIAGYRAGADAAVPGTKVAYGYSQDWEDQAKCKELALNQIAAGSKVVFQVAGGCGLGALSAAKDRGVWGIGVDADQSFLGPHVLTSALKGVDASVFLTVKAVLDGTWSGGTNAEFGLDQDGVGLGKVSPKAGKADVAKVLAVEKKIADGEITGIPTTVR